MGGITSKFVDTVVNESEQEHTPKGKRLPFDPRSPSEEIARTPIMTLETPNNRNRMDTPALAKTDKIVDPRSPNCDVNRTPIIVEKKEAPRRPLSLKPATDMKLDSFLCAPNDKNEGEDEQDPRSPTTKVPRTPLEDKVLDLEITKSSSDSEEDQVVNTETAKQEVEDTQEENKNLVKKLFSSDGEGDKARRPLGQIRNTVTAKTPRDLLQAKHCKNVEVEYNKNIRSLLPDQENVIHSKTDFVEDI
ncbi:cell division cycle-associated protein 3-like [Palaemon carinicauda]|uniref:cell division cycle-associated protein 3-like n=1 Tax=Palaemon carinicauda TaxID=392227 RepID=UPI0035B61EF9